MPISLSDLQEIQDTTTPHLMKGVATSDAQNLGRSSDITYHPPEEMSIGEKLASDLIKPIAQIPKFIGSGLFAFGDTLGSDVERDKAARQMQEHYPEGFLIDDHRTWKQKLGDRIATAGLILMERTDKYVAENFPEHTNWLDDVVQSTPMLGGIMGVGALIGAAPAVAAGAVTFGAQSAFDSYYQARQQGKTSQEADRIATLMGLGAGGAAAFGMDRFIKGTGSWFKRSLKGALAGFVGMAGQSLATGTIKFATGLEEFHGRDSLIQLMEEAAYTGSIGAALGGAVSVPIVLAQHRGLTDGFKKLGYSDRLSKEYATKMLQQGAHDILNWVEKEIKYTPQEVSRIQLKPKLADFDLKNLPIKEQQQRLDQLDQYFTPENRVEFVQTDRQQEVAAIKEAKERIKEYRRQIKEGDLSSEQKEVLRKEIDRLSELNPKIQREKITVLKQELQNLRQGFREGRSITRDEIKDAQESVLDAIKNSDLEAKDKAKFLATIKNIQTSDQLASHLPDIQNRIITLEQRAEQKRMVDNIQKLKVERLPIEYQDAISEITKNFDLTRKSKNQIIEKEKTRRFFEEKLSQEEPLSPEESQALDLARTKSLSEMNYEEFKAVHDLIMTLVHQGRLKNKLLTMQDIRNFDQWRTKVAADITEGLTKDNMNTLMEDAIAKNQNLIGKTEQQIKDYISSQLLPEVMFDWLGMDPVFQKTHEAVAKKEVAYHKVTDTFRRMYSKIDIAEAYGKKYDFEIKVGDKTINYKGDRALSLSQVAEIYALAQNDKGLKHLQGSGITEAEITHFSKWLKEENPSMIEAINNQFDYYDKIQYPRLDDIVMRTRGVHMTQESPYFPFKDLIDVPENLAEKGMYERAYPFSGFTKARLNSEKGIKNFDYFGKIIRNAAEVEHYINMAETIRDLNKIFTDPIIKDAIRTKFGENWVNRLQKLVRDLAWNGNEVKGDADKIMARLRENMVIAKLGFNYLTMAKQWASYSVGDVFVGGNWVKGATKDLLMAHDKWVSFIDEKSPMMKNRAYTQEKELIERVKRLGQKGLQPFDWEQKIVKESMAGIQYQDKIVAGTVWLGAYRKALAEGIGTVKEDALAIAEADRAVRRTQSMGGILYTPDFFRGSEVAKTWALFQNQSNKQYNLLIDLAHDAKLGKVSTSEIAAKLAGYVLFPALLYGFLSRKRVQQGNELIADIATQSVGLDVTMGFLVQMWAMGVTNPNTPLGSTLEDLNYTFTAKNPETRFGRGVSLISDLRGLPLRNIYRVGTGKLFEPVKERKQKSSTGFGRSGGI